MLHHERTIITITHQVPLIYPIPGLAFEGPYLVFNQFGYLNIKQRQHMAARRSKTTHARPGMHMQQCSAVPIKCM